MMGNTISHLLLAESGAVEEIKEGLDMLLIVELGCG